MPRSPVPDPFDDHLDEPPSRWDAGGPAFGRRPAGVESLRDELLRYVAEPDDAGDAVALGGARIEASRRAEP